MINTAILFLILIFFTSSILGYGYVFNNKLLKLDLNTGEHGLIGFFLLYLISVFLNFFIPISLFFSFSILIVGFFSFIIFFLKKKIFIFKSDLLIIALSTLGAITINIHDDHLLYQLPYIELKQQFKIIFGLIHLNDTLAYQHGLYDIMSLFNLPFYNNRLVFLIPVIFVMFFFFIIKEKIILEKKGIIFYYCLLIITLFLLKFTRTKEFGTDVPVIVLLFLIQLYSLEYLKKKNIENFYKIIIFSLLAILFKLYAILIIFNFLIFYREIFFFIKNLIFKKKIILFLFIFSCALTFSKNLINSGCINYPVSKTCFDKKYINWSIGKDFSSFRESHLKASIKGWLPYVRSTKFKDLIMPEEYLKRFKYNFHKNVFKDPDFERILIVIFIIFLVFSINFFSNRKSKNIYNTPIVYDKLILASTFSFLSWFLLLPHVRYGGYAYISFFLFLILDYFYSFKEINKKFYYVFIIILLTYFSAKNFNRIDKEIDSIATKKDLNFFPIPNYIKLEYEKITKNGVEFNISKHKTMCGLISFPCLPYHYKDLEIIISERNNFKFLTANNIQKLYLLKREIVELQDFKRGRDGYEDGLIVKD